MAVTRKIKPGDLDNAITSLLEDKKTSIEPEKTELKINETPKEKRIKITFGMNTSTKDELLEYCKVHDMTLTAGIKKAIREMLSKKEE